MCDAKHAAIHLQLHPCRWNWTASPRLQMVVPDRMRWRPTQQGQRAAHQARANQQAGASRPPCILRLLAGSPPSCATTAQRLLR
eukprot:7386222-Prymnesium_polylepis.2